MKLKKLRELTNTSADELAKLLNISVQSYYRYETGQNEPSIEKLKILADFYQISIDFICDYENDNSKKMNLLTPEQTQLFEAVSKLNKENALLALGYVNGLLTNQNGNTQK